MSFDPKQLVFGVPTKSGTDLVIGMGGGGGKIAPGDRLEVLHEGRWVPVLVLPPEVQSHPVPVIGGTDLVGYTSTWYGKEIRPDGSEGTLKIKLLGSQVRRV